MSNFQSNDWFLTCMGEIIDFFDYKRIPLSSKERANRKGTYPYYGASGIIDYIDDYIFEGRYLLVAEDGENLNSRKLPIAFFANDKFWVNNHAHIIRGKKGIADDRFLKHWFANADISGYITGAAQPKLSQGNFVRIAIHLPSYEIQRQIASILSAYDDLIENNTRRIAILEEMARLIYQEWFVKFRFPGHEKVKMVESELGPIPEGWEVRSLGEISDMVMGQSPKSEFYNENGEGLPFHQGVSDFGTLYPKDRVYCTVKNRLAEKGDILFSVRAPVGRINVTTKRIVIGRGLAAIRSKDGFQSFLLCQLKDKFIEEDIMGGGTIFKAVTKKDMVEMKLIQPDKTLIERFDNTVDPMWTLIRALSEKNTNLRTQRDLLLPKLISGEIDVSDLSKNLEDAAA